MIRKKNDSISVFVSLALSGVVLVFLAACVSPEKRLQEQLYENSLEMARNSEARRIREAFEMALHFHDLGQYELALKALDLDMSQHFFLTDWGPLEDARTLLMADLLNRLGRHEEALDRLDTSLRHHQRIYESRLKSSHAITFSSYAITFSSHAITFSRLLAQRALVHLAMDDRDLALADADKAVRLVPDGWPGHFAKARSLDALGRKAEAIRAYRTFLELSQPDEPVELQQFARERLNLLEVSKQDE